MFEWLWTIFSLGAPEEGPRGWIILALYVVCIRFTRKRFVPNAGVFLAEG